MGFIGSLLYPENETLAKELNDKHDKLQRINNLHNDLINSYHFLGEKVKRFDAKLMALTALQYHISYDQEDLSNLPDDVMPRTTKRLSDTIEIYASGAIGVKLIIDGVVAIYNKVGNLITESGILRGAVNEAGNVDMVELMDGVGAEAETISLGSRIMSSSTVSALTATEAAEMRELLAELEPVAAEASEAASLAEEASASTEAASEIAADASEIVAAGGEVAEVAEAGAAAAGAGACSVLMPILVVVVATTEILGIFNAASDKKALLEASGKLDGYIKDATDSANKVKKLIEKLLKIASSDITAYNSMLKKLRKSENNDQYYRDFATTGIDGYIAAMSGINYSNNGAVAGYQLAAGNDLDQAIAFIRNHLASSSVMTDVVIMIKKRMKINNMTDMPDNDKFLSTVADAKSIGLDEVIAYNRYRRQIVEVASMLAPLHEEIIKGTPPGAPLPVMPSSPVLNPPNPNFVPKPENFKFPSPHNRRRVA